MSQTPHPTADIKPSSFGGNSKGIKFIDIASPIAEEVLDSDKVGNTFRDYPIIPYSGNEKASSHKLVNLLYSFLGMSTTFSGIVKAEKTYSLKGKLDVIYQEDDIFNIGNEKDVSEQAKSVFAEFVRSLVFHNCNIKEFAYKCSDSISATGMVGVEVIVSMFLDVKTITIKFHRPSCFCFMRNNDIGSMVAISKKWDDDYIKKHPPIEVPVFPNEGTYADKTTRTFFYYQENGLLYGRPSDLSCIWDKYNEFKLKEYLTKKNKKLWIPDLLIETEDAETTGGFADDLSAQDSGYKNAADKIAQKFTNQGDDTLSFVVTNRPHGSKPMFIHEFKGLQNADQIKLYREMFKESILDANNFPRLLLDMDGATGFSTNIFFDVFSIVSVTKIKERQNILAQFINKIINYAFAVQGKTNELGIKFTSPLQGLFDEYTNSKRSDFQQPSSEGINSKTTTSL